MDVVDFLVGQPVSARPEPLPIDRRQRLDEHARRSRADLDPAKRRAAHRPRRKRMTDVREPPLRRLLEDAGLGTGLITPADVGLDPFVNPPGEEPTWRPETVLVAWDDDHEVVVRVDAERIEIAPFRGSWFSVAGPVVPVIRKPATVWRADLPNTLREAAAVLQPLVADARRRRRKTYRRCAFCARRFAPEHLDTFDHRRVCHGCAESELGVVH